MLNSIYLYWFHNDTLAENNSLNGHSNEPWINGKKVRHISCQVKSYWCKRYANSLSSVRNWENIVILLCSQNNQISMPLARGMKIFLTLMKNLIYYLIIRELYRESIQSINTFINSTPFSSLSANPIKSSSTLKQISVVDLFLYA